MNNILLKNRKFPNHMDSTKFDEYKYWTGKNGVVHGEARVWRNTTAGEGLRGTGAPIKNINLELSIQRCTFPKGTKYE